MDETTNFFIGPNGSERIYHLEDHFPHNEIKEISHKELDFLSSIGFKCCNQCNKKQKTKAFKKTMEPLLDDLANSFMPKGCVVKVYIKKDPGQRLEKIWEKEWT